MASPTNKKMLEELSLPSQNILKQRGGSFFRHHSVCIQIFQLVSQMTQSSLDHVLGLVI
jgi:hypothetical protein